MTKAQIRHYGASGAAAVAGALLWKNHRVWGFILGGMLGSGLYMFVTGASAAVGTATQKTTETTQGLDES